MNFSELCTRTRQLLRDTNKTIFQESDIQNGINEGIARVKQIVRPLKMLTELSDGGDIPNGLPEEYHHLLSVYSASRCFFTDEQFVQSTTLMNEFEQKMFELKTDVESGDVVLTDSNGNVISNSINNSIDAVTDVYFKRVHSNYDEVIY